MTDSGNARRRGTDKRRRLAAAAAKVLHEQGVERTTLADIAGAADVPVGNVYYYFKTKDELVTAALNEQTAHLTELTERLDQLPDPRDRLKGLVEAWTEQPDLTARYGCPTGTLAVELGKRADGTLDAQAGVVIQQLLDWAEHQFRELGLPDSAGLSMTLVAAYQGMSLLSNALRDPNVMTSQGARLARWLDSLTADDTA
ncbi:TetR/AcrR family transcriptional regulator [Streptomyces sp. NPDC005574]|uniref:TetR/AcrR family transcriptional regulator n=1 Tax=Streptomyces sp. NPDC005574 TaxID=3156891 RepID=UPI0033BFA259